MTKMTKKVALSYAVAMMTNTDLPTIEGFTAEDVVAKLNEMLASLDKKVSGEKPMTENQKQNVNFKEDILSLLMDGKARTATEILNSTPAFEGIGMTNQRVSALLRQLILDGKVSKSPVKGKMYFTIVAEGE